MSFSPSEPTAAGHALNQGPRTRSLMQLQRMYDRSSLVTAQAKMAEALSQRSGTAPSPQSFQRKENRTGLPDNLKSGIEALSGRSMDNVRVHYNSSQPAQLEALAYAQGTDIHIAPGQERHLPHEAWHVVQQQQGRVRPTMQLRQRVDINDDQGLEREADVMGAKALQLKSHESSAGNLQATPAPAAEGPIQLIFNGKFLQDVIFSSDVDQQSLTDPYDDTSLDLAERSRTQGRGTAYIVNAIVSYTELGALQEVIAAMVDGLEEQDAQRIAIIIGVNSRKDDQAAMEEVVAGAQDIIDRYPFPVALVPLTFEGPFPYGAMRNRVLHSWETQQMTRYFTHLRLHPYVSIQDFDTGSRRTGNERGRHVFHAIDRLVPAIGDDDRDDDESAMPSLPLMIAGGYRVGDMETLKERTKKRMGTQMSDEELDKKLLAFSKEIEADMRYRQEYARLDPMLPYAPEPNLFLDATAVLRGSPNGVRLNFGEGAAESTEMNKNVSRFAADELETYFTQEYQAASRELQSQGFAENSQRHQAMLERIRNEMMLNSQTRRHPVRSTTVEANFTDLNVETDLSRLAASGIEKSKTAQSHEGLTTVVDRFFDSKSDKTNVNASKVRTDFVKEFSGGFRIKDPLNKKWRKEKALKVGKTMSKALSVPYGGGLFKGMNYGVQSSQKREFLYQVAIEQALRERMDRVAMIQNFQHQAFALHGTDVMLRVQQWTEPDGDCGIYALGHLLGQQDLTRDSLAARLNDLRTVGGTQAAQGITGRNNHLWLDFQQVAQIGLLLGLADIAVVTFNLETNTWAVLYGDPATSQHIVGGVPASLSGPINHWVVLSRQ